MNYFRFNFFFNTIFLMFLNPLFAASKYSFNNLKQKLIKSGFSKDFINEIYESPQVTPDILNISNYLRHNEYALNYKQFYTKPAVKKAKDYLNKNINTLEKAENIYGVEKNVIVAIISVETRCGRFLGKASVLNILSSLSILDENDFKRRIFESIPKDLRLDKNVFERKAKAKQIWAFKELKAFLSYVQKEKINPAYIKGSYAGAMGIPQFIPSNVLKLGVDADNDGKVDLFNHQDAIFSVANFLNYYGWNKNISEDRKYEILKFYNNSPPYIKTILKISKLLDEAN